MRHLFLIVFLISFGCKNKKLTDDEIQSIVDKNKLKHVFMSYYPKMGYEVGDRLTELEINNGRLTKKDEDIVYSLIYDQDQYDLKLLKSTFNEDYIGLLYHQNNPSWGHNSYNISLKGILSVYEKKYWIKTDLEGNQPTGSPNKYIDDSFILKNTTNVIYIYGSYSPDDGMFYSKDKYGNKIKSSYSIYINHFTKESFGNYLKNLTDKENDKEENNVSNQQKRDLNREKHNKRTLEDI